jgi:hypothetical protein
MDAVSPASAGLDLLRDRRQRKRRGNPGLCQIARRLTGDPFHRIRLVVTFAKPARIL